MSPNTKCYTRYIFLVLIVATLACTSEFFGGIGIAGKNLQPLHTPVPNPVDGEILQNGLTIAEDANTGKHTYGVKEVETRNGFGGINMAQTFVIHHEFIESGVMVTNDRDEGSQTYLRIGVNTYQGPQVETSDCEDVMFLRTYHVEGFSNYFECRTNERIRAMITYEIIDE